MIKGKIKQEIWQSLCIHHALNQNICNPQTAPLTKLCDHNTYVRHATPYLGDFKNNFRTLSLCSFLYIAWHVFH